MAHVIVGNLKVKTFLVRPQFGHRHDMVLDRQNALRSGPRFPFFSKKNLYVKNRQEKVVFSLLQSESYYKWYDFFYFYT